MHQYNYDFDDVPISKKFIRRKILSVENIHPKDNHVGGLEHDNICVWCGNPNIHALGLCWNCLIKMGRNKL
jgi:hypothetical protein